MKPARWPEADRPSSRPTHATFGVCPANAHIVPFGNGWCPITQFPTMNRVAQKTSQVCSISSRHAELEPSARSTDVQVAHSR